MANLADEIYDSSDYSSNSAACIEYIRGNLQALTPIVAKLGNKPEIAARITALYSNSELATRLQYAIWPTSFGSSGGKGAIYPVLSEALEPIANNLFNAGLVDIAAELRAFYR